MKRQTVQFLIFFIILITLFVLYRNGFFENIFHTKTQREAFYEKLKSADESLAAQWLQAGDTALQNPVNILSAYSERATFYTANEATAFSFPVMAGRRITIAIQNSGTKKLFVDLFEKDSAALKNIVQADTTQSVLQAETVMGGRFVVRLQPLPGYSGTYDFTLSTKPLIAWPVKSGVSSNIGSFWGADRDGGRRSHQGVDIFAKKGSPLVAAADGYVSRVEENTLGGKVIFLRPDDLPVSLYYAHLDQQLIEPGTKVKTGDVIGTVGNTGNARNTPPHLHFGVYTRGGAINPMGFLQKPSVPQKTNESLPPVQKKAITKKIQLYSVPDAKTPSQNLGKRETIVVNAVTSNFYRVAATNGKRGYILKNQW